MMLVQSALSFQIEQEIFFFEFFIIIIFPDNLSTARVQKLLANTLHQSQGRVQ